MVDSVAENDPEYSAEAAEDDVDLPHRPKPSKKLLTLVLIPLIVAVGVGSILNLTLRAYFIAEHPLGLLIVNPTNAYVLLVQDRIDTFSYYVTIIARRMFADPSLYLLGYWYGATAIAMVKKHSRDIGMIAEKLEQWFPKYGWLLIIFWPKEIVMVMAGASAMRFRTFIALDFIGTLFTAVLLREFGYLVDTQVNWVTEIFLKYWIPITIGTIVIFALQSYLSRDAEKSSPKSFSDYRRELEGDDPPGLAGTNERDDDWVGDPLDRPRPPRKPPIE